MTYPPDTMSLAAKVESAGCNSRKSAKFSVHYLVGTPKGRLTRLEKQLIAKPWQQARPGVQVKLLAQEGELYVLAQSRDRLPKSGRCGGGS
jgi:hypothetical protein